MKIVLKKKKMKALKDACKKKWFYLSIRELKRVKVIAVKEKNSQAFRFGCIIMAEIIITGFDVNTSKWKLSSGPHFVPSPSQFTDLV